MELKVILALTAVGIATLLIWYINGALVTPVVSGKNICIQLCVKAAGSAPELEYTVDGLLWLIDNGTIPGEILIIDEGMDDYTRLTAEMLVKDDSRIHFNSVGDYGAGTRAN